MKRLLVLTVALVVAWLGLLPQTAGAVPLAPQAVASHSYDGHREDAGSICTTTERGPPARCEHNTAYDAGDRWSCGASASPNPPRTRLAYGYDVLGRFAQSARSSRGAEEQVEQVGSAEPGPVVVRRSRVAANTGSRFGSLTHSSSGIAPYSVQRTVTAGQGGSIQAHHLIERRFADVMGQTVGDMPSIVVTRAEHQVFTNAWREAIPYGPNGTGMATRAQVEGAARQIYREYPEILQALGLG